jgi:hypothetical protein
VHGGGMDLKFRTMSARLLKGRQRMVTVNYWIHETCFCLNGKKKCPRVQAILDEELLVECDFMQSRLPSVVRFFHDAGTLPLCSRF